MTIIDWFHPLVIEAIADDDAITSIEDANEGDLTRAIARSLNARGVNKLWVTGANNFHSELDDCIADLSYTSPQSAVKNDLAWSEAAQPILPESIVQIKVRHLRTTISQPNHLALFLGDLFWQAINKLQDDSLEAVGLYFLPEQDEADERYSSRLIPDRGRMRIIIDPSNCHEIHPSSNAWLDPVSGLIRPTSRSMVNKIVGTGTNPKMIGFFNRGPSVLRFDCRVMNGVVANSRLITYEIESVEYSTPDLPLELWLP